MSSPRDPTAALPEHAICFFLPWGVVSESLAVLAIGIKPSWGSDARTGVFLHRMEFHDISKWVLQCSRLSEGVHSAEKRRAARAIFAIFFLRERG